MDYNKYLIKISKKISEPGVKWRMKGVLGFGVGWKILGLGVGVGWRIYQGWAFDEECIRVRCRMKNISGLGVGWRMYQGWL